MTKVILAQGVFLFFQIIIWILVGRCLLSFLPNINWFSQPFRALKDITDPILEPFRKIIPPIGGIDISPIAAFIVLQLLAKAICYVIILI